MTTSLRPAGGEDTPTSGGALALDRQPSPLDVRPLELISDLCSALEHRGVSYCHWKSNQAIARSATGANDLDLLVGEQEIESFVRELRHLRFVLAEMPTERRSPDVDDYYGLDVTGRFVHVHAHYRLILGDDTTKNHRLPMEEAYLASARNDGMFKVPAPEFEYVGFILRMALKHATGDAILSFKGRLSASERRELEFLQERIQREDVTRVLRAHLPAVDGSSSSVVSGALRRRAPFSFGSGPRPSWRVGSSPGPADLSKRMPCFVSGAARIGGSFDTCSGDLPDGALRPAAS